MKNEKKDLKIEKRMWIILNEACASFYVIMVMYSGW